MLALYSSSADVYESDRYADTDKGGKTIPYPHVVVYGTTVPHSLYDGLSHDHIINGFVGRTLIFDVGGYNPKRRRVREIEVPSDIIDTAMAWGGGRDGGGDLDVTARVIPITDEADKIAVDFIDYEHEQTVACGDDTAGALWARTAENAEKLALLYAASRDHRDIIIDADAVQWGYGLSTYMTRRMIRIIEASVSSNAFHANVLRAKARIESSGGEIGRRQLMRCMHMRARTHARMR